MSADKSFLFELYTEEIPAFYQIRLIEDWSARIPELLNSNLLEFTGVAVSGTSRRVYVIISGLKEVQKRVEKKVKGPPESACLKDGRPTNALLGFAKKIGVEADKVEFESVDGGRYATGYTHEGGALALEILPGIFETLIKTQSFPRTMKWADLKITYARPVISYTAIWGSKSTTFSGGIWDIIRSSEKPRGHFILGPELVEVADATDYEAAMKKNGILVNHKERREAIRKMLHDSAGGQTVIENEKLLDEVNFLVEKPAVIRGSFPHEFLEMPDIVILSEMQDHQRYFGLYNKDGRLSNEFLIVANSDSANGRASEFIRKGNERVLRARLSDGSYFYREDRKKKLIDRVDNLGRIVFHDGLGTIHNKKERLKKISGLLREFVYPGVNDEILARACDLCKADLTTHLVYEFDHLQGQIGAIYAGFDGENREVADAIFEHYLPRNVNDEFPKSPLGVLLSIADKLDNIISGHLIGKQPTSSQDPLGLRRQTLYIIDMIIQNRISMSLSRIIGPALDFYSEFKFNLNILPALNEFFKGRLATIFEKDGFDRKLVNAALGTENDNLYELHLKLSSLKAFQKDENFLLMMAAFKRMNNIVSDYLLKNPSGLDKTTVNAGFFSDSREGRLLEISEKLSGMIEKSGVGGDCSYDEIFRYLASVKKDVDEFFDNVMVMHEDAVIRLNRLALLKRAVSALKGMMNIELIQ